MALCGDPMHVFTQIGCAAACTALLALPAHADERPCNRRIGAIVIDGDVHVSPSGTCTLDGTRIGGNIKLNESGSLIASSVRVGGNIEADGTANVVVLFDSSIDGNVQAKQGGQVRIEGVRVGGDVQLFSNSGAITVRDSHIGGNLQCKSNLRFPTGSGNQVGGNKEDQCSRL